MRPVERGTAPQAYAQYGDAIGDLEDRLGRYCSYCERRLPISLAVEHMAPKSLHQNRELDWSNFLLGCTNCNSVKGTTDVADEDTLWPDRHNTLLALVYSRGGFVDIAGGLSLQLQRRAQTLIDLVELDRHGGYGQPPPARRDRRWRDREEAWAAAEKCREGFEALDKSDEARGLVLDAARYCGFFSVWFAVFEQHIDIRLALVDAFPGTARSCFDEQAGLIKRPGAEI